MCKKQLCIALLWNQLAWAASAAETPQVVVRYLKDTPANTVYAWERWGNFINAVPGDGKEIPYDAAKLKARVFAFPAGEIRVIDFNAKVRTHEHVNMTDTILYTWSGRRVQFVNDQAEHNRPGDAAFHPRGVFHHGEAVETGKGVEFAMFADQVRPNPEATWRFAKDTPWQSYHEAFDAAAAKAPASAARLQARVFDFPPYAARDLQLTKGATLPLDVSKQQMLILLAGAVTVSTAGRSYDLAVDDTAYAKPGVPFMLRATENAKVLIGIVPRDTPPPPAFR
jgi:quercetin dioxygenase-like cupin family protein